MPLFDLHLPTSRRSTALTELSSRDTQPLHTPSIVRRVNVPTPECSGRLVACTCVCIYGMHCESCVLFFVAEMSPQQFQRRASSVAINRLKISHGQNHARSLTTTRKMQGDTRPHSGDSGEGARESQRKHAYPAVKIQTPPKKHVCCSSVQ